MESALHPLQSQVRTSAGEVKSELRHRADTFSGNGLLVPFSINGKQHNIVAVNGRAIIQAKINGTVVPMYLHTGQSKQSKAPGFIPYAGMHVSAPDQNGRFTTWHMKGGGKWEDLGHKNIDTGEPILKLNGSYTQYGDNLTPNGKSESEGWGHPDLNAARKQITGLFFHNTQIPTGGSMERFISPQSFPDMLHIDSDKPEHYDMARQIASQQAFNMPKAFSTRGDFWGQDEHQLGLALRARSNAIVRSITDNVAHPTNGRSAQTATFQRIRQLLDTTFRRSMIMKPNPFPLQLSLLAKASSDLSDSNNQDFWNPRMGPPRFTMPERDPNKATFGISLADFLPRPGTRPFANEEEEIVPQKNPEMTERLQRQEMTGDSGDTAESANAFIPEQIAQNKRDEKSSSYKTQTRNFMSDAMHSLGPIYLQGDSSSKALHVLNEHFPETYRRLASDGKFVRDANDHVSRMRSMKKRDELSVGNYFRQWVREQGRDFDSTGKLDSFANDQRDIVDNLRRPPYNRDQSMPVTHPFFEWYRSKLPNNPVVMALSSAILGEGHPGIQSAHDAFLRKPTISTILARRGMPPEERPAKDMGQPAPPPEAPLRNSFYEDMPLHEIYNQLSKAYKTPAWQRAEGQNPKGGLNAKGRASAKAEGHNLKAPVKSGDNPRRASFLARMGNSPGPEYDEHGKPTRLLLSLQAWGASSKADARKKAKAISARLKISKSQSDGPPGLDLGKKKEVAEAIAPATALRDHYRTLPSMVRIGADLDGDDIEGPRGFKNQRQTGSVESLTTYQHPVIRDMMHHDVVVAMHHRSMNTHHGYQQGVGDEPGHYSSELENELSGMARYSGSQRLQTSFPWSGKVRRVSNPPSEDESVFYHATPADWAGPVDPKKTRIGPSHEGGAGFYGTDELSIANVYRKVKDSLAPEGPAYEYRAPFRGMALFPLPISNNDDDDDEVEIEPHIKKRIVRWMKDMSKRHLGADTKHLKLSIDDKRHPYTQHGLGVDISRLVDAIYPKVTTKASSINNGFMYRDLKTHLLTMALTAAGYHGTSRYIPRNFGDDRASHSVFSFFPASWALLRRTGRIPGASPDITASYDQELSFLDAKPVKKDKFRARQPRDKGIRGRISTANPWR